MDWFYLAHDRDQWQTLLNMVLNLYVPEVFETSRQAEQLLTSEEGL